MSTSIGRKAGSAPRTDDGAAALLSVVLERGAAEPLGRQLVLRIRDLIQREQLAAGARLPSSRRLAQDLGVSRAVTLAAYEQLAAEGYVEARRGSGQYVCTLERTRPATAARGEGGARALAAPLWAESWARLRGRPFDPDAPAFDLFPTREWARLMARGWRRDAVAATRYGAWAGLPSLRAAIAGHLRALQGLDYAAEQVVITAGNADALQLIARALAAPGDQVWLEDPGHVGARRTFQGERLTPVAVPVDGDGLDVAAGRRLAPRARLALVTPARQFPLGAPLSLPRRLALMEWARQTGAVVVADDYDSELRFSGRPLAALASLDPAETVLSIGSFSRLTFPGLRLGYVAGPAGLIARLVQARALEGAPIATGAQPALADFIAGGGFARHLRGLRRRMGQRRKALIEALSGRLGPDVSILPQEAGLHLTLAVEGAAGGPSDEEVAARAAAHGLNLAPLSAHAMGEAGRQGFLLGYAAWDEAELAAAADVLTAVLRGR